jgi:polysaccharide biosynthesis transport protein
MAKVNPIGYINVLKTNAITPEILNKRADGMESSLILFKELLKKLRFEIENSGGKIFLYTSSRSAEGKSSIIIALASALVASGKRVLIIDTNFKNNTLTKAYSAKPTLETAVNKDLKQEEFITKTNYSNLDVIGSKGGNYSPSEIFPERKLGMFLDQLKPYYDFIFLEGTFLNQYADSKELVAYSDKVIGIFSSKSVLKQSDKESLNYLKGLNSKFLGVVLNKVENDYIDL